MNTKLMDSGSTHITACLMLRHDYLDRLYCISSVAHEWCLDQEIRVSCQGIAVVATNFLSLYEVQGQPPLTTISNCRIVISSASRINPIQCIVAILRRMESHKVLYITYVTSKADQEPSKSIVVLSNIQRSKHNKLHEWLALAQKDDQLMMMDTLIPCFQTRIGICNLQQPSMAAINSKQ